jgi:transposase
VIPAGVEIYVGLEPIDLRWGFDRLAGLVEDRLGRVARSGGLFVFFGKRRTAVKALFFDGTGLCLFYKRLDRGRFRLPSALEEGAASRELDERELDELLSGLHLELPPPRRARRRLH